MQNLHFLEIAHYIHLWPEKAKQIRLNDLLSIKKESKHLLSSFEHQTTTHYLPFQWFGNKDFFIIIFDGWWTKDYRLSVIKFS